MELNRGVYFTIQLECTFPIIHALYYTVPFYRRPREWREVVEFRRVFRTCNKNSQLLCVGDHIGISKNSNIPIGILLLLLEFACDTRLLKIRNYTTGEVLKFRTFREFMKATIKLLQE